MNKKVLRTMIIISYCLVFICFILRRFFITDMFDITKDNATLNKICLYLQDNNIIRQIALFPFYFSFNAFYLLSIYKLKWFDKKALWLNFVAILISYVLICLFPKHLLLIYIFQLLVIPIITKPCKQTTIDTFIGFVVTIFFVLSLSYIKGIVIWQNIDLYKLFIFSIDIYIVEAIHYLYRANYSLIPTQLRSESKCNL